VRFAAGWLEEIFLPNGHYPQGRLFLIDRRYDLVNFLSSHPHIEFKNAQAHPCSKPFADSILNSDVDNTRTLILLDI
jgi:muconolactone delta-isomerase